MTVTCKGNDNARVTGEKLTVTETQATATVTLKGALSKVTTVMGSTYKVGSKMTVLGTSELEITQLDLEREDGGIGRLTVTASKGLDKDKDDDGGDQQPEKSYHVELDFTTVTKPLSGHPEYGSKISAADWEAIRRWESLKGESRYAGRYAAFESPTTAAAQKEDGPDPSLAGDWAGLAGRAKDYAEHLARGVTEYMVQVPVVRRTKQEKFNENDTISKVGKKVSSDDVPKPFRSTADVWMKTADRWSRDSKHGYYNHYEEWSGFDELDEVLYGEGYADEGENNNGDEGGSSGGEGGNGGGEGGNGGGEGE